ncbi:MAG: AEC family transporter [Erysipelotrichaceae bacterium]|nr:AEC family transporter [Erysipelotrichaceae bacterium]
MYRGNFMLFGFSIIGNFYAGQNIVTASILVAIVVPFLNVSSVLLMSYYNGRNVGFSQLAVSVITNPLIIAAIIAAILNLFGIMPPEIIIGSCDTLSSMATPLALIALGASMKATDIRNNFSRLSLISLVKLILLPLAATSAGIIAGYRGLDLFCIMILFAAPSAISSYSLAQSMGSDGTLAGEAVMVTTVLSSATIIGWICALMALGYV